MTHLKPIFLSAALVALLLATQQSANAVVILLEDFDDATIGYTSTLADPGVSDLSESYFGRVGGAGGLTVGGGINFTNTSGGYFGANATAGAPSIGTGAINWTGINIANFNNLTFSGWFAEDDDASLETWDPNSEVRVRAQIDGGGFFDVFGIQASQDTDPMTPPVANQTPRVDTNLDGFGEGAEITDTFTQFVANIAGTGSLLDLQIFVGGLTEAGEDIAFDNIMISGDSVAAPEPGSLALLSSLACGGFFMRRRRKHSDSVS